MGPTLDTKPTSVFFQGASSDRASWSAQALQADSARRDDLVCVVAGRGTLDVLVTSTMHGFMAIKRRALADEIPELVAYIAGPHAAMITGSLQTLGGGFGA